METKIVSFADDKIIQDEDINSMLDLTVRLKDLSDVLKNQIIKELTEKYSGNWLDRWLNGYKHSQVYASEDFISNYIRSNISDLFTTSILWFNNKYFSKYIKDNRLYFAPVNTYGNYGVYLNTEIIQKSECDPSIIYLILNQSADRHIMGIANAFDADIQNKIITMMNEGSIMEFFKDWYKEIHNEEPNNFDYRYIYTFCMSLMREQAEEEIIKIRKAMELVIGNAIDMYTEAYKNNGVEKIPQYIKNIDRLKNKTVWDEEVRELVRERSKVQRDFDRANVLNKIKLGSKLIGIDYKISMKKIGIMSELDKPKELN